MPKSILIVDDEVNTTLLLAKLLQKQGYHVLTAFNYAAAVSQLKSPVDLVLTDYRLGNATGGHLLQYINQHQPDVPVVMMTGYPDVKLAVELARNGVYDYLVKPLNTAELIECIENALTEPEAEAEHHYVAPINARPMVTGISATSVAMLRHIELIASTRCNVVIQGASGTGKEHMARSIHQQSDRSEMPFVAVDCGTLSLELAPSQLFGHEAGAFTGADTLKVGYFEIANGGTLFLDEIGNLSYDVQALLLRVIQEQKLKRVGSLKELSIDVRIIVASNRDLRSAVKAGILREDLYYRLNELTVEAPLLSQRTEDIRLFANSFLEEANAETGRSIAGFDDDVMDLFEGYEWPGNIRELRNMVRRAALLATGKFITLKELPSDIIAAQLLKHENEQEVLTVLKAEKMLHFLKGGRYTHELGHILTVLKNTNYNRTRTADILNINRKTLYNRLRKACA